MKLAGMRAAAHILSGCSRVRALLLLLLLLLLLYRGARDVYVIDIHRDRARADVSMCRFALAPFFPFLYG